MLVSLRSQYEGGSNGYFSLDSTEGADLSNASVSLLITANLSAIEGSDTSSGAVALVVSTALNSTDGADSLASEFLISYGATSFSMAVGDGADTLSGGIEAELTAARSTVRMDSRVYTQMMPGGLAVSVPSRVKDLQQFGILRVTA